MNATTMLPGDRYTDADRGSTRDRGRDTLGASDTVRIEPRDVTRPEPPVDPVTPNVPTDARRARSRFDRDPPADRADPPARSSSVGLLAVGVSSSPDRVCGGASVMRSPAPSAERSNDAASTGA